MPQNYPRRVAVTGLGVVSPFGSGVQAFFEHMLRGDSAVRLYRHASAARPLALPAVHCADFDPFEAVGRKLANVMDRFSQLGAAAAFQAWADAGLPPEGVGDKANWGVSWGTGVGGTMTFEQGYRDVMLDGKERVSPLSVPLAMNNAAASQIAIALGLGGSCPTFSVACSSSSVAIGEAFLRIRAGMDELIVTGGSEAPLAEGVIRAWDAMRVLARGDEQTAPGVCRPFDAKRAGLVLGEGGAALILEDWEHAVARGARIYCEIVGYGASCDHTHLVKPSPDGQARAIRQALRQGGLSTEQVGYINAHGTATPEGDPAEIVAIKEVFGEYAAELATSATKSMHAHLLGAAGAVEALITVMAVHQKALPPTANLQTVSPDCEGVRHLSKACEVPLLHAALSNSFAFGGSNAVLAFKTANA